MPSHRYGARFARNIRAITAPEGISPKGDKDMAQAYGVAARFAPPLAGERGWPAYWTALGQPWRIEPDISPERQAVLRGCRAARIDIARGVFPFAGVRLSRADIEWLLATHDGGRGPVDWRDSAQRERRGLDLRGADLREAKLGGLPLARTLASLSHDAWLAASPDVRAQAVAQLAGADLSHAQLDGALLCGVRLAGADLSSASLTRAQLFTARLEGAVLVAANLRRADLRGAQLDGANLARTRLDRAALRGASLVGASLAGAVAERVNLSEASLEQADLSLVVAHRANLWAARLSGATLFWAHLEGANLNEAHLEGSTLEGAHLSGAQLGNAHLEGANLGFADLTGCALAGAALHGARLYGADLSAANLSGAHLEGFAPAPADLGALRRWCPELPAVLPPADLRLALFSFATDLDEIHLGEARYGYVTVADTLWETASLAGVRWAAVTELGDERLARETYSASGTRKTAAELLEDLRAAIRAYERLAEVLQRQGAVTDAARFVRRAQTLRKGAALREGIQRFHNVRSRAQALFHPQLMA